MEYHDQPTVRLLLNWHRNGVYLSTNWGFFVLPFLTIPFTARAVLGASPTVRGRPVYFSHFPLCPIRSPALDN
jgi:hypothetical protein